eukprot:CAMPEP_0194205128 /NCGR_PEP_ID=MMETSP0156-20130528/4467_1 /TAXON_ID=33649 /ORGANISM="Thalassionema nitzschioides, Strain L26-B" /LENGTH=384 /DNA_ID=CAMNT_0038931315 /DNA_START=60 /DNA_END=1211 /DNA_ORIENTATION=+
MVKVGRRDTVRTRPSMSIIAAAVMSMGMIGFAFNASSVFQIQSPGLLGNVGDEGTGFCNQESLKKSIQSKKFQSIKATASLKETVALKKAELLLQNPLLESFPKLLKDCETQLAKSSSSSNSGLYYDTVIKQVYLEGLLELKMPEYITNDLLKSLDGKIVPTSIVDIGANVGQTVIPLAKDGHKVYSFEPVASTCQKLKDNISKENVGKTVEVFCAGIDEKEETKSFGYRGNIDPGSEAYKIVDPTNSATHVMSTVKTAPVEKFLNGANMLDRIQLFKTDTQGNEEAVLRGSYRLLSGPHRPRFVLIEYSHYLLTAAGTKPRTILEIIYSAGYVCTHLRYHHLLEKKPTRKYDLFDTPKGMRAGGISATFDEMAASIGPEHKSW